MSNAQLKNFGVQYANKNSEVFFNTFVYKNIRKGMGITIGNALRRILLSQISGYAIRYVVINEVAHEFTSINGLKEDVQEFIMNLKKIIFSGDVKSAKISVNFNKSGAIYASDIKSSSLNIVNEDLYLCTLSAGFELKFEMFVEKGVGVSLVRNIMNNAYEMNSILCDAFYNPIINVNYEVEDIESSEFEEVLTLQIQTNGSISPKDALQNALSILNKESEKIFDLKIVDDTVHSSKLLRVNSKNLFMRITDMPLITTRIINCIKMLKSLEGKDIIYVGELVQFTRDELLMRPNFGENSLNQLIEILKTMGLSLGMQIDWKRPSEEFDLIG